MSMPHDATEIHPKGMLGRLRMNVRSALVSTGVGFALAFAGIAFAQAPAGSTGECKDGSYTTNATKRGACSGHKGVKEWYGSKGESQAEKAPKAARTTKAEKAAAEKSAAEAAAPSKSSRAGGAGAMGAAGAPSTSMAASNASKNSAMRTTAAAGGGAGKVWVNTSSNVYHCMNDEWYGKTKQGEYMSEADAKAKGAHAARGKACS
jgi:hypothetical protein